MFKLLRCKDPLIQSLLPRCIEAIQPNGHLLTVLWGYPCFLTQGQCALALPPFHASVFVSFPCSQDLLKHAEEQAVRERAMVDQVVARIAAENTAGAHA
jgi:hypothetical protein